MYEIHNIFYFSNEMIYYFSFWISGWNSLRKQRSLLAARVETPLGGENQRETAVFAGYSLNPTMVLPLDETPLGEVKQRTI